MKNKELIGIDENCFINTISIVLIKRYGNIIPLIYAYKIADFAFKNNIFLTEGYISASVSDVLEFLEEKKECLSFNHGNGCPCITIKGNKKDFNDFGWIADGNKIKPFLDCTIEKELLPTTLYAIIPQGTKTTDILNDYPTKKYDLSIEKPSVTNFITFNPAKNYLAKEYYYSPKEQSLVLYGGIHHRSLQNQ